LFFLIFGKTFRLMKKITLCLSLFFAWNAISQFCEPVYVNGKTDGDLISNVVITGTTLANSTGTDPVNPYYTYFSGQPSYTATLQPGDVYQISISVGSYGEQNVSVWIDYNDDAVFDESERVGHTTDQIDAFGTGTFTITLSCDPMAGTHRMRIRDVWNTAGASIDPCEEYGYGETEDYDIAIVPPTGCIMPFSLTTGAVNATTAQLDWSVGCGQLSWDVHVAPVGNGAPAGAPSHPDVAAHPLVVNGLEPSTAYEFYVMADCGDAGTSDWAGPFAFTTAPPAVPNDECEAAYTLTVGGNFDQYAMVATNAAASKSIGYPNPTCAAFAFGGDVWFSAVVPDDGHLVIETKPEAGSPLIDTGLNAFSGTCGALTVLGCNDEGGEAGFSLLSLNGLTPGTTIYARVWEYANDTVGAFRVAAYNPSLGTAGFDGGAMDYWPNPVRDVLHVRYKTRIDKAQVYTMTGQFISETTIGLETGQIDTSGLPSGIYMVKIYSGGISHTLEIAKTR
jgi:hypothetical protein